MGKRQRLLDNEMFARKTTKLVKFIWSVWNNGINSDTGRERESISFGLDSVDQMLQEIRLTPELFERLRKYSEFHDLLTDLDIMDEDQVDLFETLDVDGSGTVDIEEFIVAIYKLRGDARRSDIVGVSLMTRSIQQSVVAILDGIKRLEKFEKRKLTASSLGSQLDRNTNRTNSRSVTSKSG